MTVRLPGPPGRRPGRDYYVTVALALVGVLLIGAGVWITRSDDGDGRPGPGLPANAASGDLPKGPCAPGRLLEPPCGAWWGAYVPYAENGSLKDAVLTFEKKIGRRLDLVYNYHDMSKTPLDGELLTPDEQELGRDRLLMLAWESTVWTEPHHADWTETQLGWKNIASGRYDRDIIDPQARRIKAYGKRVFLSFDQETDFRIKEGAGTPEEFVAAWRHLHDRFRQLGVDNVVWVWTVSGYLGHAEQMKRLYPGDAYVDWIGMDQYNYYLCHNSTNWLDFDRSQRPSYDWLRANISADKPLMLAEFATAPDPERPQRQRDWYAAIPDVVPELPKVRALVHWNRPVPGKGCDLTVNEGPALEGYREAGKDAYFRQPVPTR
ncbi:glycosyl hydrolase [Streptomyces sp. TRM49041]|uniref:glycoside hydrolase family 26 protein n=1 Tax=Streptomyces sp. TRM49041 TaxID=2603216 RepID=UPI0011EFDA9D|nr:glycosyl hydrolase [Streptomyces sp. TRM49041]